MVTDIVVKTQPATLTYTEGQTLDLTGLEVTLTFGDATTQDVVYADFGAYGISMDYTGAGAAMHGDRLMVAEHNGKTVTLSCNGQSAQTEALTVSAAIVQHTITATAGTGGSISPSGSVTVNDDDSQTFTITPNSGYHISRVTVDDVNQGAISSYTFTNVTADHTIHAVFAADSSGGGGGGGTVTQPSDKEDESKKEGTTGNLQGVDPKATKPFQLKTDDGIQVTIPPGALSRWKYWSHLMILWSITARRIMRRDIAKVNGKFCFHFVMSSEKN